MKQLLFLLLFPALALAQYQGNANQKITLGEQTTADGLVFRGVLNDTALITPLSDTSAYIILDTVNNKFYNYNRATNVWSVAGGGTAVTSITGGTGLTGGTITSTGTLAADTSFLFTQSDTLSLNLTSRLASKLNIADTTNMLLPYFRDADTTTLNLTSRFAAKQNNITLTTTGTSGAATLTGATLNIPQYSGGASGVTSFSAGSTGLTPSTATTGAVTLGGTLGVANGGTNASTFTTGSVVFAGTGGTYTQDNANLFFDNGNNRLGINTNSPTAPLHVVGAGYLTTKLGVGLDPVGIGGAVLGLQTTNNNTEYFRGYNSSGQTRFAWDLSNDYGILSVHATTGQIIKLNTNGDSFLNGGNVGIGTASPLAKLNVMGTVRINSASAPDANYYLQLENSASQKAKANAWDTYSDKRIKTDIQPILYAIDKVNLLNPVYYQKHDSYVENDLLNIDFNSSVKSLGFIAQEVFNVIPEAVNTGTTSELWAMDYTKIIPILTKAIQEQNALIKALEQRIIYLENK